METDRLAQYIRKLEEDPRSLAFAPLADLYRRNGQYNDSLNILKKGISHHPDYILAQIVLSEVYFDQKQYQLCCKTLSPYIDLYPENLRLQKTYAASLLKMGQVGDAVEIYRKLSFLNPNDKEVKNILTSIGGHSTNAENENRESILVERFNDANLTTLVNRAESDWTQVDLREGSIEKEVEHWESEWDEERAVAGQVKIEEESNDEPIFTHTLVNLYCSQGHYDKAIDVLEKILLLNPNDEASKVRLESLKKTMQEIEEPLAIDEEPELPQVPSVEKKLLNFLSGINSVASKKKVPFDISKTI